MIYPNNFEEKIGFSTIRELLYEKCLSSLGASRVEEIRFTSDFDSLKLMLEQTDEFRKMLLLERAFPSQDFYNMQGVLKQLQVEGSFIEQEDLKDLRSSLKTILAIQDFLEGLEDEKYPTLKLLLEELFIPEEITKELGRILDDKGMISDKASPELADIRQSIRKKQLESDKRIRQFLNLAKKEGWVEEDAEPSIRNERLVIPMMAGNKRKIKGFVHDVSTTGQTVFIEPEEIFDLNNAVRELENEERLEIIKILKNFSSQLRPFIPAIIHAYDFLGMIDFLRAKAQLAIQLQGVMPLLVNTQKIAWLDAKHPLLFLTLEKQYKPIVPLNISLDQEHRILIISGPNAGGKSVCLKTVGLLQYMLQCGLLVPMRETSEAGLFESLFIDIGDEQSLENDLSTYSSHLNNMKNMVAYADEKSLFLSDELGSGTEPQVGGAIAEALLEDLLEKQAFGVVTTHYANLKLMADQHAAIINGAMLFDTTRIKPLYILKIGMPGSSFAFELAKNIGLQEAILAVASEKIGSGHFQFEQQLQQLEVEKKQLEQERLEFKLADELLVETLDKYQRLKDDLEGKKREIIHQAKSDAKHIVEKANQLVEKTIREIKESQAEKSQTQKIRESFENETTTLLSETKERSKKVKKLSKTAEEGQRPTRELKKGDYVRVIQNGTAAEIIELKNGRAVVVSGLMKFTLPVDQLTWVPQGEVPKQRQKSSFSGIISEINEKKTHFKPNIDLRGMNAEEAIDSLMKFIDDAVLFSEKHLSILHGKGNGVLRKLVRDFLNHRKEVSDMHYEHPDRGGDGITVVELH